MDETFTLLPIHLDPTSKALSSPSLPSLTASHLSPLTALHRTLLSLPAEHHAVPPPPLPTSPKRSAQIQKMREQGNTSLRRATAGNPAPAHEAIKLYTYALEMALGRPGWEPVGLVRDEAGILYANRSQAHMTIGAWPEGAADAETSVALKRTGNGKAWWRRGKCLVEMGRWAEAHGWLQEGLGVEGAEGELASLAREVEAHISQEAAAI